MPFGLTNGPAAFQQFMNNIFRDLLDQCIVVYLDNILIYSNNPEQHTKHIQEVLQQLRKHGLYAQAKKCEWHHNSVEFLRYIMSSDGLTMADDKICAILDWPKPWKVKDVQSCLGFANFYQSFIHNYSEITVPLTRLTRKGLTWDFSKDCHAVFRTLKEAFTRAPVLAHWKPDQWMVMETDASDYALVAILSGYNMEGALHPITFHSCTFTGPELNYNMHDKELSAIFKAFKWWRHYLEGLAEPIDVVTDHKNLECFSMTKLLTRHQARWSELLSQFNLIICFCGRLGTKPDALTRWWDIYLKEGGYTYETVNPQNLRPIFTATQLTESLQATSLIMPAIWASITMDSEKLLANIKAHQAINNEALKHINNTSDPRWIQSADSLLRHDDRIYVPETRNLWLRVLQYKHDHILSGHFSQNKTLASVRREYTWPRLQNFVTEFCKSCMTCMHSKSQRHQPYGLLKQLPIPKQPWNSISMDFIE